MQRNSIIPNNNDNSNERFFFIQKLIQWYVLFPKGVNASFDRLVASHARAWLTRVGARFCSKAKMHE